MIQYQGNDVYHIDLNGIQGDFLKADLEEMMLDLMKVEHFNEFFSDEKLDGVYEYNKGYDEGRESGYQEGRDEGSYEDTDYTMKSSIINAIQSTKREIIESIERTVGG